MHLCPMVPAFLSSPLMPHTRSAVTDAPSVGRKICGTGWFSRARPGTHRSQRAQTPGLPACPRGLWTSCLRWGEQVPHCAAEACGEPWMLLGRTMPRVKEQRKRWLLAAPSGCGTAPPCPAVFLCLKKSCVCDPQWMCCESEFVRLSILFTPPPRLPPFLSCFPLLKGLFPCILSSILYLPF